MSGFDLDPETKKALDEAQRQQQEHYQRLQAPPPRPGMATTGDGLYVADREQTPAAIGGHLEGFAHAVGDAQAQAEALVAAAEGGGFGDGPDGEAVKAMLRQLGGELKATTEGLGEGTGVLWRTTLDGFRSLDGQDAESVAGLTTKLEGWEP